MKTSLFDYNLPRELIAATPPQRREDARLLVVHRATGQIEHRTFSDVGDYLRSGDLVVVNNSRVIRARIHGKRMATGGGVEFLLLERVAQTPTNDTWRVMCRPAKKLKPGEVVYFANKRLTATITHYLDEGEREAEFSAPDVLAWLDEIGEVPLPPYIVQRRREMSEEGHAAPPVDDVARYQTVYARDPGSIAAPTAGLHFTDSMLGELRQKGIETAAVTLHVGAGTFKPVECEDIENHPMHSERFSISQETADAVNRAKAEGRRIVAVGTTSVRTLESAADENGIVRAGETTTSLLIMPGYQFRAVDALITNFHLPRSTLLMLVSAFANRDLILHAYEEAVRERYRFFSYGDAMMIL